MLPSSQCAHVYKGRRETKFWCIEKMLVDQRVALEICRNLGQSPEACGGGGGGVVDSYLEVATCSPKYQPINVNR